MLTGKHLLLLKGTIHRCSEFGIGFQVSSRVGSGLMLLGDYLRCMLGSLVLMLLLHMVIVVVVSGALRLIRVRSIVTVCVISLSSLHSGGIVHSVRR